MSVAINCPVCGYFETQVQQTNKKPDCVRRTRMCMNCGHVFHTIEDLNKPKRIKAKKKVADGT